MHRQIGNSDQKDRNDEHEQMNAHFIILLDDLVQNVGILDLFTGLSIKLRALDTVEREIFTLLRVFE
jgi:hypothetical protein